MAFVSLLGNEAVGFYVCSADFFFSSDLKRMDVNLMMRIHLGGWIGVWLI